MDEPRTKAPSPGGVAPAPSPVPDQKIGVYSLIEKLGAGGIGEVWKARDRRLNRVVALKFISATRYGSSPTRDLLREARAASALNHPNIVTVFDVGESEGATYLAMEFVEGEPLRARMKRGAIPFEESMEIAAQIVNGLAEAHRHGIVHRDLKPENIMLRADGYVKIVDFGLAKVLPWGQEQTADALEAAPDTEPGQLVGTFTYMSPEQARGRGLTPASDVFSLGIVLYEMLTGEHPFRAETTMDTLNSILNREPPAARARSSAVPPAVSDAIAVALRKDAEQRFPTAVELRNQLQEARAAPSSRGSQAAAAAVPAVRQKPAWVKAIGAALIGALLLAAGWFARTGAPARTGAGVESVAVMTFRAEPGDTSASALGQGLPEELGVALERTGMQVASRSSILELRDTSDVRTVGAQLGVDAVLEGNVRSAGSKLKIHVELVSTRTRFQIWSQTFTVELADLLGGEEKIAAEIAAEMRQALAKGK